MAQATTSNTLQPQRLLRSVKHPVRLTALLTLKDALLKERYEECADVIAIAQEFGAAPYEIRNLLEDARRVPAA